MKNRVTEDEMIGWHHRFNRYELGQTPEDGEGQRDRESWRAAVHGVSNSWTSLGDLTTTRDKTWILGSGKTFLKNK